MAPTFVQRIISAHLGGSNRSFKSGDGEYLVLSREMREMARLYIVFSGFVQSSLTSVVETSGHMLTKSTHEIWLTACHTTTWVICCMYINNS